MASKSPDAFRTISEVAEWLNTPAHVLRFWESKFSQVKPVKRAGGRRYYRPADMALIGGIKKLLHDDGMTIKGAQKLLREQGIKHVAAMSPPLDEDLEAIIEPPLERSGASPPPITPKGQVLTFSSRQNEHAEDAELAETEPPALPETTRVPDTPDMFEDIDTDGENLFDADSETVVVESSIHDDHIAPTEVDPAKIADAAPEAPAKPETPVAAAGAPSEETPKEAADVSTALPAFLKRPLSPSPAEETASEATSEPVPPTVPEPVETTPAPIDTKAIEPAPAPEPATETKQKDAEAPQETAPEPAAKEPEPRPDLKPQIVDTPPDPTDHDPQVTPGLLTVLARRSDTRDIDVETLAPLLRKLRDLQSKMADAARN